MKDLREDSMRKAIVEHFLIDRIKHLHIRKGEMFILKGHEDEKA